MMLGPAESWLGSPGIITTGACGAWLWSWLKADDVFHSSGRFAGGRGRGSRGARRGCALRVLPAVGGLVLVLFLEIRSTQGGLSRDSGHSPAVCQGTCADCISLCTSPCCCRTAQAGERMSLPWARVVGRSHLQTRFFGRAAAP